MSYFCQSLNRCIPNPAVVRSSLMRAAVWLIDEARFDKSLSFLNPLFSNVYLTVVHTSSVLASVLAVCIF